jgi:antitoxin-like ribbon-helix-helix protein
VIEIYHGAISGLTSSLSKESGLPSLFKPMHGSDVAPPTTMHLRTYPMIGKRVQFHDETWQELRLLAAESMKSFQELADEAFNDLLKKHGRPSSLKEALRKSAGQTAKVIPLKRRGRTPKGRP